MTAGCKRCQTQKTNITSAEGEVRRLARQMSRTTNPKRLATLKEQLAVAKHWFAEARESAASEHDHDTRLIDEHWTKTGRRA